MIQPSHVPCPVAVASNWILAILLEQHWGRPKVVQIGIFGAAALINARSFQSQPPASPRTHGELRLAGRRSHLLFVGA